MMIFYRESRVDYYHTPIYWCTIQS